MLITIKERFFNSKLIKSLFEEVNSKGLAIFRVLFFSVLLLEIIQMIYFQEIIFRSNDNNLSLYIWMFTVILMIVGFQFQLSAIINYIFVVYFISNFTDFEYHIDHIYVSTSLLAIFFPYAKSLSLDAISNQNKDTNAYRFYYVITLFVSVAFVYFESILHKLDSNIWLNGLGVWLPASFPHTTFLDLTFLLNQKWMVIFFSHLTLVFEFFFIFLIFYRQFKLPLLFLGGALHIGILFFFPIPLFALAMCTFYVLFIPERILKRIVPIKFILPFNISVFNFNRIIPVSQRKNIIKYTLVGVVIVFSYFELLLLTKSPLTEKILTQSGLSYSLPHKITNKLYSITKPISRKAFGISPHGVFTDLHFTGYDHIIAIVDKESDDFLPLLDKNGQVSYYNTGRLWAKYSFRTMNPKLNNNQLNDGIKLFTKFWLQENELDDQNRVFKILVKKIHSSDEWEPDLLEKNLSSEWEIVGEVSWDNGQYRSELPDIEKI